MPQECEPACPCQTDLCTALAELNDYTELLSTTLAAESRESIERRYAELRAAQARVRGAMANYLDHLQGIQRDPCEIAGRVDYR
jgi:hypothetical protein